MVCIYSAQDRYLSNIKCSINSFHIAIFLNFLNVSDIYLVDLGIDKGFIYTGKRKSNVYSHTAFIIFSEFASKKKSQRRSNR